MVKYNQEDIEKSAFLTIRFIIVKLIYKCKSNANRCIDAGYGVKVFMWILLKKEFEALLTYFDDDNKINEEYLIKLYNNIYESDITEINLVLMRRIIKLIEIT